jgi:peptidoglycan/xylan/chitin deacetylase (PgdA/CDA1 family)
MIRNFLFHRVNPKRDPLWDPMDVELFDKCIGFIKKKYEIVRFEDVYDSPAFLSSKNKFATIMFDDGYKDNLEYAAPILANHGVKASFYVVTNCIDHGEPTWTHKLEYYFQNTRKNQLELDFQFIKQDFRFVKFGAKEDRVNFVSSLKPYFKSLTDINRNIALNAIYSSFDDVQVENFMMNWEDVRSLSKNGHYIGSHTVSHDMLGTITDIEKIEFELKESANRIHQELGYCPLTISYPIGSYDEKVKELSKSAGYEIGLAVNQQIYKPQKNDIFEVPRIELYNESWFKTRLRISDRLEQIKRLIQYK